MTQRRDTVKLYLVFVCLEKEFSDRKRAPTPSVRTNLRFILYVESKMLFKPIPDRSKYITSINTLEFLLRKQAHMIISHTALGLVLCVNIDDYKRKHHFELAKLFIISFYNEAENSLYIFCI